MAEEPAVTCDGCMDLPQVQVVQDGTDDRLFFECPSRTHICFSGCLAAEIRQIVVADDMKAAGVLGRFDQPPCDALGICWRVAEIVKVVA
jgi:hypothetical protein